METGEAESVSGRHQLTPAHLDLVLGLRERERERERERIRRRDDEMS